MTGRGCRLRDERGQDGLPAFAGGGQVPGIGVAGGFGQPGGAASVMGWVPLRAETASTCGLTRP